MTLPFVGQVQDLGDRFVAQLAWLRRNTVALTRVNKMIYTPPPEFNEYLSTIPYSGPQLQDFPQTPTGPNHLWFFPIPLVLGGTNTQSPAGGTTGIVSTAYQPEVPETEAWALSAHGYYQGISVEG